MALQDLLNLSNEGRKIGISEERLEPILPIIGKYVGFWREYPDLFVDFLVRGTAEENREDSGFHFYFYQRVFLRAFMRYQYSYMTFPRAYSKSFLSVLGLMINCILYPGIKLFSTSGGKEQAASILHDKVNEICRLIPALRREIDWGRGKTQEGKDYVKYVFKNGSELDNLAARESTRGQRRNGGLIEECVGVDGQILQEVIIPVMAITRRKADGSRDETEPSNKKQCYITTAGFKNTFPYEKLISFLVRMVTQPERCIVLGGTWRTPVEVGLQSKTFIKDQKEEGTFNEISFGREYESIWAGVSDGAFFDLDIIDRNRILNQPEYQATERNMSVNTNQYYILSCDVGRHQCDSVCTVIKVIPQPQGTDIKNVVCVYTESDEHFGNQAIWLKRLYYKYKARRLVIDGNGLGTGLIDFMVQKQVDAETGEEFPDFGVYNDADGRYKKFRTPECEQDAIYIIKANAPINTEAHSTVQTWLRTGRIKFLIDVPTAQQKLLSTVRGKNMTPEERAEYLKPFNLTSILVEEMLNLREENEGVNIILKQANRGIKKDKFSALEYGMYYIKTEEEGSKKKKRFNAKEWSFFN